MSLTGYTWHCGLKYTDKKLQTLQNKEVIFLLENDTRGGIFSVMADRCVKKRRQQRILYFDPKICMIGLWVITCFLLNLNLIELLN